MKIYNRKPKVSFLGAQSKNHFVLIKKQWTHSVRHNQLLKFSVSPARFPVQETFLKPSHNSFQDSSFSPLKTAVIGIGVGIAVGVGAAALATAAGAAVATLGAGQVAASLVSVLVASASNVGFQAGAEALVNHLAGQDLFHADTVETAMQGATMLPQVWAVSAFGKALGSALPMPVKVVANLSASAFTGVLGASLSRMVSDAVAGRPFHLNSSEVAENFALNLVLEGVLKTGTRFGRGFNPFPETPTIAVIGGGPAGYGGALQLGQRLGEYGQKARIVVVDPAATSALGGGAGFSSVQDGIITNAAFGHSMHTLFQGSSATVAGVLDAHASHLVGDGFVPRYVQGPEYLSAEHRMLADQYPSVEIAHSRSRAVGVRALNDPNQTLVFTLEDGRSVRAEAAILAMGGRHVPLPFVSPDALQHPGYAGSTIAMLAGQAPVPSSFQPGSRGRSFYIGTGLSSVDMLVMNKGEGPIVALSRRGLWPLSHDPNAGSYPKNAKNRFLSDLQLIVSSSRDLDPAVGVNAFVERFIQELDQVSAKPLMPGVRDIVTRGQQNGLDPEAMAHQVGKFVIDALRDQPRLDKPGLSWISVANGLRRETAAFYSQFTPQQKAYFERVVGPYWNVIRQRNAPLRDDMIASLHESGRLITHSGSIHHVGVNPETGKLQVQYTPAGYDRPLIEDFDTVVNGTPLDFRVGRDPFSQQLIKEGILSPGPNSVGYDVGGRSLPHVVAYGGNIGGLFREAAWPDYRLQGRVGAEILTDYILGRARHGRPSTPSPSSMARLKDRFVELSSFRPEEH